MKRNWFARHPIGFMALYFLLYLSAFNFLETQISMPRVLLVHCRLDDLIPFCKYAILPYFAWFAWIPFTLFYLLWKAPREDFWRLCLPLFGGMTIALACYVILPTGLDLRPYYVPGTDLFARAVRMLYRTDTPTNVCPSIHVFNSMTLMLAYHRCRLFEEPAAAGCVRLPMCCASPSCVPPCCSSSTAASTWCWVPCWHWCWMPCSTVPLSAANSRRSGTLKRIPSECPARKPSGSDPQSKRAEAHRKRALPPFVVV